MSSESSRVLNTFSGELVGGPLEHPAESLQLCYQAMETPLGRAGMGVVEEEGGGVKRQQWRPLFSEEEETALAATLSRAAQDGRLAEATDLFLRLVRADKETEEKLMKRRHVIIYAARLLHDTTKVLKLAREFRFIGPGALFFYSVDEREEGLIRAMLEAAAGTPPQGGEGGAGRRW